MNERHVSCKAFAGLLRAAKQRPGALDALVEGCDFGPARLQNTKQFVSWPEFCRVIRNARQFWSPEELSDLNEAMMQTPLFKTIGAFARFLFTTRDLYEWMLKQMVGGGAQLFTDCVKTSFRHVGDDTTIIIMEIRDDLEPSDEYFWMTRGSAAAMPHVVGGGRAAVEMTIDGRLGTFVCKYKNKVGTVSGFVSWVKWPFAARAAALELKRSNEELQARFYELEDARAKLDRQAAQLTIAHSINSLVQRDLPLDALLATVAEALITEAHFAGVRIVLQEDVEELGRVDMGDLDTSTLLDRVLAAPGSGRIGGVTVALGTQPRDRQEAIVELTLPTIAMAITNALHRKRLEQRVNLRTLELSSARDELAINLAKLHEVQQERARFFANISHEFRTPLAIILLAAADVERRMATMLDDKSVQNLGVVNDAARKLQRLVEELLLLAAGEEDKLAAHSEPMDLGALVQRLAVAWRAMAEQAGLTFEVRGPAMLMADLDPVAIERVTSNLLSNAVKYTPAGGSVELELVRLDDGGMRLSVYDTGTGIDAELKARLFGRFERSSGDDRRKQGTGLGLYLAKQLVEVHGGTIEAYARASGGSELRIELPESRVLPDRTTAKRSDRLRMTEALVAAPTTVKNRDRIVPAGISRGTILLAEDDTQLAQMISDVLSEEYTVVVAHDGLTALELAGEVRPQLLVTDVDMPGLNGIELSAKFREQANDELAPIIILSAVLDLNTRISGLEAGAVDYVTKPFDPFELKARVKAQFRMRELVSRLHRAEQLATLSFLTSGLAHELRNPANGITNAIAPLVALLPEELKHPEHPVAQLIDVVSECTTQIGFLARQLLGFRRADGRLELSEHELLPIIERATSLASGPLSQVRLSIDVEPTMVRCAPPLLGQVLTNLLENAAHAAGQGGWVKVRSRQQSGRIAVEVTDSGPGVPLELRTKVFEPFFTTKPPGVGTGLGLPLARDIVLRHGGVLEIRGEGDNIAFVVELPDPMKRPSPGAQ